MEVTDGCPLNGMYRRFKHWIKEGATAFPNLTIKIVPGMDPIMQFDNKAEIVDGDLGLARVDVSDMEIGEVEDLLQRRGLVKDPSLADKAEFMRKEREAKEEEAKKARDEERKEALKAQADTPVA